MEFGWNEMIEEIKWNVYESPDEAMKWFFSVSQLVHSNKEVCNGDYLELIKK